MPDIAWLETEVLAALREALTGDTRLARCLTRLQPTKQLARMLGGEGASLIETPFSSIRKPPGLASHRSREISVAQVTTKGDFQYATAALP